jgi:hypothetical protein
MGDAELLRRPRGRGHDCPVGDPSGLAPPVVVAQTFDPGVGVADPSGDHRGARCAHLLGDLSIGKPIGGQQDDPHPLRQSRPHRDGTEQRGHQLPTAFPHQQRAAGRFAITYDPTPPKV